MEVINLHNREDHNRIQGYLNRVRAALDIRSDILENGAYNVIGGGSYESLEGRQRLFSMMNEFVTTTSYTQTAEGQSVYNHLPGWKDPLMPGDGRLPEFVEPAWWDGDDRLDMRLREPIRLPRRRQSHRPSQCRSLAQPLIQKDQGAHLLLLCRGPGENLLCHPAAKGSGSMKRTTRARVTVLR